MAAGTRVGGVALAALLLAASGARAEDTIRIGLAVPNQSFYAPAFAAQDLGYYKAANLNVEITEYRAGAAAQEALTGGAADIITYFAPGVALAVSKGAKEKIVATSEATPYAWYLLVDAKSSIQSVKDLAGKKVGVSAKASTSDMLALWAADRAGVSIQTIPLGGGAMIPALRSHQVDATAMFPPLSLKVLATGEARAIVDYGKEMDPTMPDIWVASQDIIDKHPEQVRATLTAVFKALDYMRKNRQWGLDYLKKYTKQDDDKVIELSYDEGTLKQSVDGTFEMKWIADALHIAAKAWGTPEIADMKPESISTQQFVPVKLQ